MALLANEEERSAAQAAQQETRIPQPDQTTVQTPKTAAPAPQGAPKASGYDRAMQALQAAQDRTPSFSSDYDGTIEDLYRKITGRQAFRYDAAADPLYGQYREQYVQGGQQAMRDAMGQAAALTGGYGSSYGQAVGQQQYDAYLQRLNEVLPELYRTAYDAYEAEGNRMTQQLQLAGQLRDTEYGQFRDAVGDRQAADAFAVQEAESRAKYGDFSGYEELYGKDAADSMRFAWAAANPDAAFAAGTITTDEYFTLTGRDPHVRGSGGGGGGDSIWGYGGSGWNTYGEGVPGDYSPSAYPALAQARYEHYGHT